MRSRKKMRSRLRSPKIPRPPDLNGGNTMRASRCVLTLAVSFAASLVATIAAQAPNPEVERHVAAARAAAGEHAGMVDRLCPGPVARQTAAATQPTPANRGGGPPAPPVRESWHAEPMKVFDNFYFVGMTEF